MNSLGQLAGIVVVEEARLAQIRQFYMQARRNYMMSRAQVQKLASRSYRSIDQIKKGPEVTHREN
jgi:hypothetical protein